MNNLPNNLPKLYIIIYHKYIITGVIFFICCTCFAFFIGLNIINLKKFFNIELLLLIYYLINIPLNVTNYTKITILTYII